MLSCFRTFAILFSCLSVTVLMSQEDEPDKDSDKLKDLALIDSVERGQPLPKVLHAEPLYIDLIRDLGARKGEREWNVGFGLLDQTQFAEYEFLVEYEFAVLNRLGLEIELPFAFYSANDSISTVPSNLLEGLQLAAQYTFLVSTKASTSLAIGYLHKFKMVSFEDYGSKPLYSGNLFNPFFVVAKRWGRSFHTLIYTGPEIERVFNSGSSNVVYAIHTNFDYMIPGTSNFVGIEFNKTIEEGVFHMTMRPQMRVEIDDHVLLGLVTGIPVVEEDQKLSIFFRMIYEPH